MRLAQIPSATSNYAPDSRLTVFVLRSGRPRPSSNPPTEQEKVALFDTMFAYVGTYAVETNRVPFSKPTAQ